MIIQGDSAIEKMTVHYVKRSACIITNEIHIFKTKISGLGSEKIGININIPLLVYSDASADQHQEKFFGKRIAASAGS
jgi:hypothetical protein